MAQKAIEIKGLNYSYPDGTKALSNVSLDVFGEESLGIIGPNGAGKSTLLLHLNGILRGNSYIKIFGMEVKDENLPQIRSKVGLVFQDPENQLFMPTVFDDVAFGPINMGLSKDEVKASVSEALKKVDMPDFTKRMSYHLSFGEKKRISIATVLSMKPKILVLDEPSSNLDPKHRRELINFLKELKLTKVIATHDLELVLETCSRVIVLDKGRLIAMGNTLDIFRDRPLLEAHNLEVPYSLSSIQ
ncbi:MAG: cobalt ABC transporter ATP-binding protein [Omnitrophica WOR_2 bacterium SM23_29]|nr:MAG: cobalt ABC transporter ATP-binding protein [Omnitrophica WOR_2 bacterium SM23_29]